MRFIAIACLAGLGVGWAAEKDRVMLVINENSARSRRLGAFYRDWHQLGADQICRIRVAEKESIDRKAYEREIAGPLQECLGKREQRQEVQYVVLTQGMPLRVLPERKTDGASVDSEVALLYAESRGTKIVRDGPLDNPFYRRKEMAFRQQDFPIYLVTRLAGYSFEDAKKAVERCRGARREGKVVLDLKADNDEAGNSWLRNAAILLPAEQVVLDLSTEVVAPQKRVIGYASWGSNDPARKSRKSGMEWLPGAIATEFVSTNARTFAMPPAGWTLGTWEDRASHFARSPQSMILDYVWEGVSGISGNVDEPFLAHTARPDLLFPAYLSGRNLAESFYLALPSLSWQSIVIGDPLCRLESQP